MQRKVTYRNLATWYTELREFRPEIPCIVVANKIDGGPSLLLGVCSPRGPTTLPQNSALVACHHPVLSQAAPFLHTDAPSLSRLSHFLERGPPATHRAKLPPLPIVHLLSTADRKMTQKSFNFTKKFSLPLYFVSAADGTNVVKVMVDCRV